MVPDEGTYTCAGPPQPKHRPSLGLSLCVSKMKTGWLPGKRVMQCHLGRVLAPTHCLILREQPENW